MFQVKKLLIIGVGLIGGSLALALRKAGVVQEVVGVGRKLANLQKAVELGVIDRFSQDISEEMPESDIVVVATPVLTIDSVFAAIARCEYQNSVITDVGSVKRIVVESANRHFAPGYFGFVSAHPIAGTEHSGVEAAEVGLFNNRRTILTPTDQSSQQAVEKVKLMWEAAGSAVSEMEVEFHDEILSASSHLPHLAAFGLVHYIANHKSYRECFDLAASGFYDFTRIASSDPVMWRDICLANSDAILQELNGYIVELQSIARSISAENLEEIHNLFSCAKAERDRNLAEFFK